MQVNHLPYMPFPPTWPTYIPKDMLAHWFEAYAESMELNFWTGIELEGGVYDHEARRWAATLRRLDGSACTVHPRHVVMATGVSGIPNRPDMPTLHNFKGEVLHSSQYRDGDDWTDRKAMVIGTGNSGHDIAQDLHSSGAEGHAGPAQPDPDRQRRTQRAASLRPLRTRGRLWKTAISSPPRCRCPW